MIVNHQKGPEQSRIKIEPRVEIERGESLPLPLTWSFKPPLKPTITNSIRINKPE